MLYAFKRGGVNQRAHRNIIAFGRVAKLHGFHRLTQTVHKAVVNALLHINTLGTVTNLPGVDHARIHNRLHRQLKVRIVHHDSRRFTAQLQANLSDVFRGGSHDFLTGADAARHAHHRHFRVARQLLTHGFTAPQHEVKYPFRQADFIHNFGKSNGVIRGELARLDNDRVAGQQRGRKLAGNQEKREVPRQNAGGHAKRAFEDQDIFARPVALDDFPFVATRPLGHVVDIVGSKCHLNLSQLLNFPAFGHN